jgi:ribosomal protein L7/L12
MAKYQVTVTNVSQEKVILLIKSLQIIADLGLKDAKELAEFLTATIPCILVAGIDREVANHVLSLLQEAGATAAIEESNLVVPLLLCPQANRRHRWSWLRGPVPIE